jgi:ferredoxin
MKVNVDEELCCGSGLCVVNADQVFDQREEDGVVILLTGDPAPELHGAVRAAAAVCPTSAIKLAD